MDTEQKLLVWHDNDHVRRHYQQDVIKFIADNTFGMELRSDREGRTIEVYGRFTGSKLDRFIPITSLGWYS